MTLATTLVPGLALDLALDLGRIAPYSTAPSRLNRR